MILFCHRICLIFKDDEFLHDIAIAFHTLPIFFYVGMKENASMPTRYILWWTAENVKDPK